MPYKTQAAAKRALKEWQEKANQRLTEYKDMTKIKKDFISDVIEDDLMMLNYKAMILFAKKKCFLCSKPLWKQDLDLDKATDYEKAENFTGRMMNTGESNMLIENNWVTLCPACLKKLYMKKVLEEGSNY